MLVDSLGGKLDRWGSGVEDSQILLVFVFDEEPYFLKPMSKIVIFFPSDPKLCNHITSPEMTFFINEIHNIFSLGVRIVPELFMGL